MSTTEAEGLNALKDRLTDSANVVSDFAAALGEKERAPDKDAETKAVVDTAEYLTQLEAEEAHLRTQANRLREEASLLRAKAAVDDLCSDVEWWVSLLRARPIGSDAEHTLFVEIMKKRNSLRDAYYDYAYSLCQAPSPTTSDNS